VAAERRPRTEARHRRQDYGSEGLTNKARDRRNVNLSLLPKTSSISCLTGGGGTAV
jgi:hypothetical protein